MMREYWHGGRRRPTGIRERAGQPVQRALIASAGIGVGLGNLVGGEGAIPKPHVVNVANESLSVPTPYVYTGRRGWEVFCRCCRR